MVITVAQGLRAIAVAYPSTAGKVSQANDLLREIAALMMQHQEPGQPMAPPTAG